MRANILFWAGDRGGGQGMIAAARGTLEILQASDPKNAVWSSLLPAALDNEEARIAFAGKDFAGARSLALASLKRFDTRKTPLTGAQIELIADAQLLAGDAEAALGNGTAAREHWSRTLEGLSQIAKPTPYQLADRYIALKKLGRIADAATVATELDRRGYRHPAYLRVRST